MQAKTLLAPGYQGGADQHILRRMIMRLAADGIEGRAMEFSTRGGRPSRDYQLEVDDLRRERDALLAGERAPLALIGRSFGGRICTFLAAAEPPDALVVLGYPIAPPDRTRPKDEAALLALTCPTLIVQGDRDELGPLAVLERIASNNPRLELAIIPGAKHSYGAKEPQAIEAAATWLKRLLTGRPSPR